jgi:regulator of sigma E protease
MSITVAILALAFLVLIHEAGHFFVARAVGMRPRKFYLGFGTPLVKTTRNGVEYGIGAFPLGGYVKIPGMHRPAPGDLRRSLRPEQAEEVTTELARLDAAIERGDDDDARGALTALEPSTGTTRAHQELDGGLAPDAYWRQATWKRIAVIAAGPAANVVLALVLFAAVFMLGSTLPTRKVIEVLPGHPAVAAGLRAGDQIVAVAGRQVKPDEIASNINATSGRQFTIVVARGGRRVTLGPLRARLDQGVYRVGFRVGGRPGGGESLPQAVGSSLHVVRFVTTDTAGAVADIFTGRDTRNISSSVGIVRTASEAFRESLQQFLAVVGLISLALALLNLLPVLPLDGGHIVMSILERIRGRSFSQMAYLRYSAVGLSLFVFLLYLGLRNDLFSGGS